jgi:acetyltransferase
MEHFNQFFSPRSVVIVGATEKTGSGTYNLMENLINEGCTARLYPVNLRAHEVLGHKAYRSVLDIPEQVDLAIITVPRAAVLQATRECVEKGIKSVIIVSQGFADADDEGLRMQEELKVIIKGSETRVVGPNSIGLANAFDNFHTSFQRFDLVKRENAMICQSGMFVLASADFSGGLGLGVDIGNGVDLGFAEFLSCMAKDPRIKVINLHMEGISNGREFLKTASRVTPEKPVLIYKVGSSEEGAKAAASHSASLAGEDRVFGAAFRKAGMLRVENLEHLKDMNKALLTYPTIKGKRFAVVTLTGGGGIAVIDALSAHGLQLASPSNGVMDAIQAMNPSWLKVSNPVDTWMASLKKGLAKTSVEILRLLLEDEMVDGAIMLLNAYRATGFTVLGEMLDGIIEEAGRNREKPVVLWAFGANQDEVIKRAERGGVVVGFTSPERLARAMAGLYKYHHKFKGQASESPPWL